MHGVSYLPTLRLSKPIHCLLAISSIVQFFLLPLSAVAVEIGVTWVGHSSMADRVTEGLTVQLNKKSPDYNLEVIRALPDTAALSKTIQYFETHKTAMVILRSNGAQYLAKYPPRIPTFIGATNDPAMIGTVKNLDAPEGNITGVTYALPIDLQFDTFQTILPDMQRIILITEKGHPSSKVEAYKMKKLAQELKIEFKAFAVKGNTQIKNVIHREKKFSDAFVVGTQAHITDKIERIVEYADKVPVFAFSLKPIIDGALAGFVADDKKLGQMLGDSIIDAIQKNIPIAQIPVKTDPKPQFFLNASTAKDLNIEIPFYVLENAVIVE